MIFLNINNYIMSQKIHFVTYGNEMYNNSKKRLYKESTNSGWFDTISCMWSRKLKQFL